MGVFKKNAAVVLVYNYYGLVKNKIGFKSKWCYMRLKDIAIIRTNFPDADFWLIRKGDEGTIGRPTKKFVESDIGIKVDKSVVVPDYLYYAMIHLHHNGFFKQFAKGTLRLVHLQVSDIKNIEIGE